MVKTRALAIGMSWRHLVNMMDYRYELAPPGEYDGLKSLTLLVWALITTVKTRALAIGTTWRHLVNNLWL